MPNLFIANDTYKSHTHTPHTHTQHIHTHTPYTHTQHIHTHTTPTHTHTHTHTRQDNVFIVYWKKILVGYKGIFNIVYHSLMNMRKVDTILEIFTYIGFFSAKYISGS